MPRILEKLGRSLRDERLLRKCLVGPEVVKIALTDFL